MLGRHGGMPRGVRVWVVRGVCWGAIGCLGAAAPAANVTWIGGNADWVDGAGNNANWNPLDEPDADDTAIFNTANGVNLGSNNSINGLTMSGGIDLSTNGFDLTVNGLVQLTGANTNLFVGGAASELNADDVAINGGDLELTGGLLTLDEESGSSLLDVNVGGTLAGHGTITLADTPLAFTVALSNDGTLTALSRPSIILNPPPVGTLQINTTTAFQLLDLDGSVDAGVVNVNRNQTLDVNGRLADAFGGTMTLFQNATLDMAGAWAMNGGTLTANNGAQGGFPAVPASASTIAGSAFTQAGGTITVADADGELRFEASFSMDGGSLVNNGLLVFDADATIANAANLTMPTSSSSITVEVGREVTINAANFNMDGSNTATNTITVNESALFINTTDYDPDAATNAFDGTINLNNGDISVVTSDAEFVMDGVLTMNSTVNANVVAWAGEPLDLGNDAGVLDADLNVTGTQQSQIGSAVDFNSDADVDVAAGATLALLSTVDFNTVNGGNNAQFTGAGLMAFSGGVNVNEAVTLNMVGGTVDLDGLDNTGDFVNIDAPMVINALAMTNFGRANGGGGANTLDVNNSVGTGALTVNLDDPAAEWTLNGPGVMNLVNDNTEATLLAGSDVQLNGTVNVTGDVRITARVDIAGVININTAGQPLRLAGGDNLDRPNTIAGGTISGAGLLGADSARSLEGFGTINAGIDFEGTANLLADDGTLTLTGAIVDANLIGTNDDDAILNVTTPWNTNAVFAATIRGGELRGATITNDGAGGILGDGLLSARVVNNTKIAAGNDLLLVVETAGNDNDWDGSTNVGMLIANFNRTLELRDVGAAFGFTGTVAATDGGRVFANGFALDFNPGSALNLTAATYESTSSTDLGGAVTIGAGAASTLKVANNFFLTFETGGTTTLNANLRLENNNINIEQGATFSGAGALVIPDGSHLVADNNADVDVLLDMQGAFRPGNFEGIGRVELLDLQLAPTSELYVELRGTGLNQFDRLVADGDVVLDGYLNIDIDEVSPGVPFVPVLGNTFNIITANTVTGAFDFYDVSGMPAGLAFHLEYLSNAVQLQVVNKPIFTADFDDDGDVDFTDLAIWKGAFDLNQLGDADGDNDSDGNDFVIWQQQLGSSANVSAVRAVPEPTGLLAVVGAAVAGRAYCLRPRRRRIY